MVPVATIKYQIQSKYQYREILYGTAGVHNEGKFYVRSCSADNRVSLIFFVIINGVGFLIFKNNK